MLYRLCFSFRCRFCSEMQSRAAMARIFSNGGPWPPPTFAAKRQRRDLIIAPSPEGVSKEGGPRPSLFGRFKGKRFLRKGGNRNPPFLKPFFGYFLSGKKVTRRRQQREEERNANGLDRTPPLHTGFRRSFRRGRCPRSGAKRNKYPLGASPRMPRRCRGISPPPALRATSLTEGGRTEGYGFPRQ